MKHTLAGGTVTEEGERYIVSTLIFFSKSQPSTSTYLRANDPMGHVEAEGYDRFRVVTRHADVQEISRQNDLFTNGPQSILFTQAHIEETLRQTGGVTVKSLIQMDGAEHQAYRGLTSAWFQPGNIKKLEARIRELARAGVDRMAALGGRCDGAVVAERPGATAGAAGSPPRMNSPAGT